MAAYEEPMLMDRFVSMPQGPVSSTTYECVCTGADGWDAFVSDRAGHCVELAKADISVEDLDELSESDVETLELTWNEFGRMNQWELVKYTHDNCPEWEDPEGSSVTIPYSRIFKFLSKENPVGLEKKILERRYSERELAKAR